jgi:hypothetical protein
MQTELEQQTFRYAKDVYGCFLSKTNRRNFYYGQLLHNIPWIPTDDKGATFFLQNGSTSTLLLLCHFETYDLFLATMYPTVWATLNVFPTCGNTSLHETHRVQQQQQTVVISKSEPCYTEDSRPAEVDGVDIQAQGV